ncbi:MAG TPA: glycerophosphodiester phosphodiesterase family protein [Mycobacteriales bacterium]|nr:glycerophosphodiester phosphodiesterase family protein [Mycobacteriales bacterium]
MTALASQPLVIAHRGASGLEPEHTAEAYRRALADGADGFECDVRLTRDGVLVCLHDRSVERTSNGRGVVSRMTLGDLQKLNFGKRRGTTASVLTFEDLLGIAVDARRPLTLLVETKHPVRYGAKVERQLVEQLRRFGLADAEGRDGLIARIMSFSPAAVRTAGRCAPGMPTVALMSRLPGGDGSKPLFGGATIAGPSLAAVKEDPAFVERVHQRGAQVYVWTVDEPDDVALLASLGVDAVITNRPDIARSVLDG